MLIAHVHFTTETFPPHHCNQVSVPDDGLGHGVGSQGLLLWRIIQRSLGFLERLWDLVLVSQ